MEASLSCRFELSDRDVVVIEGNAVIVALGLYGKVDVCTIAQRETENTFDPITFKDLTRLCHCSAEWMRSRSPVPVGINSGDLNSISPATQSKANIILEYNPLQVEICYENFQAFVSIADYAVRFIASVKNVTFTQIKYHTLPRHQSARLAIQRSLEHTNRGSAALA